MNVGFTEEEYTRVRSWLMSALELTPHIFTEVEMLARLRAESWHLVTTEHACCVLELCRIDGEMIANVLLLGGERGKALREILQAKEELCAFLGFMGFAKLVGTPRKEFHNVLKAQGFEQEQEELIKRLK